MTEVEEQDVEKLRHMLGATQFRPKKDWGFRNHFCAGSSQLEAMRRLLEAGYVVAGSEQSNGTQYFHATKEGCKAAGLGPKAIKRAMEDM